MTVEELLKKGKNEVRNNQGLADFFSMYYIKQFGNKPKFCCNFKDYDKLKKIVNKKNIEIMSLERYRVNYQGRKLLKYRDSTGRMRRKRVDKVDDVFIDEFLKLHNPERYPKLEKNIIKLADKQTPKTVVEMRELIKLANFEELKEYENDPRKGVQNAYSERLKELQSNEQTQ